MKSIRRSFSLLALASTMLVALLIGAVSVAVVVSVTERDAERLMNSVCALEAARIDNVLEDIEDAVDIEAVHIEGRLLSAAGTAAGAAAPLDTAQISTLSELFKDIAVNTKGAEAFFLSLDGAQGAPSTGFAYRRAADASGFVNMGEQAASGLVGEGRPESQGLLDMGQPHWVPPYEDASTGKLIATYVRPILHGSNRVGIVGMAVDFQVVVDQVAAMSSYETGYGFLTDAEGNVMYHPAIPFGTNLSEDDDEVPEVDRAIAEGTTSKIVTYRYQGADKRMAFHLLQNEMRLVLSVEAKEIYTQRDQLIGALVLVSIVASALAVASSLMLARRALEPLRALTASAERVAAGDLDVEILSSDVREVRDLIRSYQRTVANLRQQLAYIDGLAHRDGLTGCLNKSAYNEQRDRLDAAIRAARESGGEMPRFALVMLDVNGLKPVNDTYGHEAGDEYLRVALAQVMGIFEGDCVYRVGGDEFVVLAEGLSMHDIDRGIERLEDIMRISAKVEEPWRRTSLAYGVARFDAERDRDVADVFSRADAEMYRRKLLMKGEGAGQGGPDADAAGEARD